MGPASILLAALPAAALASADVSSIGGWRVHSAQARTRGGVRSVVVPGALQVYQVVPRARVAFEPISIDVALPVVHGRHPDSGWTETGLGRVNGALRWHPGEGRWAVVAEGGGSPVPAEHAPTVWGSHARETAAGWHAGAGVEFDYPTHLASLTVAHTTRLLWQVGRGAAPEGYASTSGMQFGHASVVPVWAGRLAVVIELEALPDAVWIRGVAAVRAGLPAGLNLDIGAQSIPLGPGATPPDLVLQLTWSP